MFVWEVWCVGFMLNLWIVGIIVICVVVVEMIYGSMVVGWVEVGVFC